MKEGEAAETPQAADEEAHCVLHRRRPCVSCMYEAPKPPAAPDRKRRRLACRRAFPWKPQQVRALTGRGVEAQLAETRGVVVVVGGGDRGMRSMQKGCHIKQPPTEHIFGRLLCQSSRVEVTSFNDYPA